jgi:DNA-binding Xre family transcriptional regulator
MEIGTEKAREYILSLKEAGKFTHEDIANLSGIPLQTVKNICTGKTPDARFWTIAKIVQSLGGKLDDIVSDEKKKEIEVNSMVSMKETYEMRIADLIKSHEQRIEDVKALCEIRIADVHKCCETRIADMKRNYEERIADQKEMFKSQK